MGLLHSSFFPIVLPLKKFDGNQMSHDSDFPCLVGGLLRVDFDLMLAEHLKRDMKVGAFIVSHDSVCEH